MLKKEFIKELATRLDVTQVRAKEVFETLSTIYVENLKKGEDMPVPGVGKFKIYHKKATRCYVPSKGTTVEVAAKSKVRFFPSINTKEM